MYNLSAEKIRNIIKVCNYYYHEGMSQQEIANRLNISRPQISRMLTIAKANGIVNITINDPFSEEHKVEQWLTQTFGLMDSVVIDAPESDKSELSRRIAIAVTGLLDTSIKENGILGIMAGLTMNSLSADIGYIEKKNLKVVPLVGGTGYVGNWQANLNARNLGEKLKCEYVQLNAPTFMASAETKKALLAEPEISSVLNLGKSSTVALVGIGQIKHTATIIRAGFLSQSNLEELKDNGATASICNSFLDKYGNCIDFSGYDRMVGITAEDLKRIPKVIGVASGVEKVPAITATLLGNWVDVIVTNLATAKEIMNYYYTLDLNHPNAKKLS